ncbi:hypothetical protein J2736_001213 [Paenibacillus qinlingensis]|uniref:Uncharacterized protein n=1 Tax=Paenibacillus qinlingensis TaxID=1837343 RepID=A0ABU1NRC7_9BACL|nr:hypothetical protein [Paenibacillus qinlingensis]
MVITWILIVCLTSLLTWMAMEHDTELEKQAICRAIDKVVRGRV